MKKCYAMCIAVILFSFVEIYPQMQFNPDSLETITIQGYAIVDSNYLPGDFYIDIDNNDSPDYHLIFGPHWYSPENSTAAKPADGDSILITGGLLDSTMLGPAILVYEINDEFWRDPYEPFWNRMGDMMTDQRHKDSCFSYAFGWRHPALEKSNLNGTILLDTTFLMNQYFLDEDNDSSPDYFLNFGPPWYIPESDVQRPEAGAQVNIVGGVLDRGSIPTVIVYELDGNTWRDSSVFAGHMSMGWFHRNMSQSMRVHNPLDDKDWLELNPGWYSMGGGHHGPMNDSIYGQILETLPGTINTLNDQQAFAAYEINFFFSQMMGGGMQNMGCGSHMQFNNQANIQLHYTDEQLQYFNISEQSIQVKYWDSDNNQWAVITDINLNQEDNTINFSSDIVANFYILSGSAPTRINDDNLTVEEFLLEQNYPNPFNPKTVIYWQSPVPGTVKLQVFDLLGREIAVLINGFMQAGRYETEFNAEQLPSGTYFYRLQIGNNVQTRKMILMK